MTGDHGIPDLYVRTRFSQEGESFIEGQHSGARTHVGREGHGHYVSVRAANLPALAAALGCEVDGIHTAWNEQSGTIVRAGERSWLREHEVDSDLWVA